MSTSSHTHSDGKCPVTGATGANPHAFCPPQPGDTRAPCPAMNAMANHGYLPRDGKCINANVIVDALMKCYRLSKPLAWVLTHGALLLLNQGSGDFCLADLARHNKVEHNASLYHPDAGPREEYAPIHGDPELMALMWKDSADGVVMTPEDVARVRVRREATSNPPIDFVHAELARGEMAIVLNCFNNPSPSLHSAGVPLQPRGTISRLVRKVLGRGDDPATRQLDGVPIERLRFWFEHERLPEDWTPYHETTLRETIDTINRLRSAMRRMAKEKKSQEKMGQKKGQEPEAKVDEMAVEVTAHPNGSKEEAHVRGLSSDSSTLAAPSLAYDTISAASSASPSPLHTPQVSEFNHAPVASMPSKDASEIERGSRGDRVVIEASSL